MLAAKMLLYETKCHLLAARNNYIACVFKRNVARKAS